ncbi:sugar ABC transporter permease [Micromonospora sp. FIMYZ51]|uniref:carbohydrate ABC transporter permease n=1 Tax=Micromonospora sp. FIMYZ51 TaxID=3051832 RepID=UPI00311D5FF8
MAGNSTTVDAEAPSSGTPAAVADRPKRRGSTQARQRDRRYYWFLLPSGIAILLLIVLPLAYTFYLSLRHYDLARGMDEFIGLANYANIFSGGDPEFIKSLLRTLLYVFVVIAVDFVLGMTQALLLFEMKPRTAKVFRMIFMLPILLIPTGAAVFWRTTMWAPPNEQFLRSLNLDGLIDPPLGNPNLALWAIIITVIWAWSPWVFLLLSGGLDYLDRSALEASQVDGAGYWQRLWHIILPLMRPIIFVTLSFKAVDSFLSFPFVWVMTQGGPQNSTHLMSTYIYEQAFKFLNYGFGSALAIVMLMISSALSIGAVLYWQRTQDKGALS